MVTLARNCRDMKLMPTVDLKKKKKKAIQLRRLRSIIVAASEKQYVDIVDSNKNHMIYVCLSERIRRCSSKQQN